MNNREQLQVEIEQLEEEANSLRRQNDETGYITKMAEVNAKRGELDQLSKAEIIAGPENPEESFKLTVGEYSVDFRVEAASEASYQAMRIVTQLKLQELEEHNQAEVKTLRSSWEIERHQFELQVSNLETSNSDAYKAIEGLKNDLREVNDHFYSANLQITDRDGKLSIAASEIESLKAQVEELRSQVSKPSVPTNMDNDALVEAMRKLRESKPAIYNVVEISGIKSTGVLVDANETVEFHPNYIGKYRVVSYEEAMQIRAELEAAKADIPDSATEIAELFSSEMELAATIEAPALPSEVSDDNTDSGLGGDSTTSESVQDYDGGEVTREEFEKLKVEVMSRLYNLEVAVHGADFVDTGDAA